MEKLDHADPRLYNVTINLETVQFPLALIDPANPAAAVDQFVRIRDRNHAIVPAICAQSVYLYKIFSEMRRALYRKVHPQADISIVIPDEASTIPEALADYGIVDEPFKVGLIGLGRIGKYVLNALLEKGVDPKHVIVSTRRPDICGEYSQKGVLCVYDNKRVASSCHIVYVCCQHSQLPAVIKDIRGLSDRFLVVVSLVSGLSYDKLCEMYKVRLAMKSELQFLYQEPSNGIIIPHYQGDIALPTQLLRTCPLRPEKGMCSHCTPCFGSC
eukprot:Opistho-2@15633